jgi:hypothetical protein
MSVATAVFTQSQYPNGQDMTQRRFHIAGTIAISASPATYPAGGIPITFASGIVPGTTKPGAVRATIDSRSGSGYQYYWTTKDLWTANYKGNSVAVGQSLVDTNGNIQTCTTNGTAGSGSEPTWNTTIGGTTTDGTVTWTNEGPSSGLLQIFQSGGSASPLAEIAQGTTIAAGISGDLISCLLEFIKG